MASLSTCISDVTERVSRQLRDDVVSVTAVVVSRERGRQLHLNNNRMMLAMPPSFPRGFALCAHMIMYT